MARTRFRPSSLTLTLGQPERMFQMSNLHVIENNCVKLFLNTATIIVEGMVRNNSD